MRGLKSWTTVDGEGGFALAAVQDLSREEGGRLAEEAADFDEAGTGGGVADGPGVEVLEVESLASHQVDPGALRVQPSRINRQID